MTEEMKTHLLSDVRESSEQMKAIRRDYQEATMEASRRRAAAIRAADDAGVPRELIAEAAGLSWPLSRQRWSDLRRG